MNNKILRLPTVKEITGLSRSSIYLHINNGSFPKPIPLGARAVGWLDSDINDWLLSRIEARGTQEAQTMHNPTQDFRDAISDAGVQPPNTIITDGKIHRFATSKKSQQDKSGWYVFHNGIIPAGQFGDWRSGINEKWRAQKTQELPTSLQQKRQQAINAAIKKQRQALQQRQTIAKQKTQQVLQMAKPLLADHPYLLRKQITPATNLFELDITTLRQIIGYTPRYNQQPLSGRIIIAPIYVNDIVCSFEMIDEQGHKSSLAGGIKKSGYWCASPLTNQSNGQPTLLIGEGIATVLSVAQAAKLPAIASLSCHNLPKVARYCRQLFPNAKLIILADLGNGQQFAEQAAEASQAQCLLPTIDGKPQTGIEDFNDLLVKHGPQAILKHFNHQQPTGQPQNR